MSYTSYVHCNELLCAKAGTQIRIQGRYCTIDAKKYRKMDPGAPGGGPRVPKGAEMDPQMDPKSTPNGTQMAPQVALCDGTIPGTPG